MPARSMPCSSPCAPQARLLAPQLALAGAGGATRVGTSAADRRQRQGGRRRGAGRHRLPERSLNAKRVRPASARGQVAPAQRTVRPVACSPSVPTPGRSPPTWTSCPTKAPDGATGTLFLDSNGNIPPAGLVDLHGAGRCRSSVVAERSQRGSAVEAAAEQHLRQAGLWPRARNVRYRGGELDLVMDDAGTVVFVEVRYRARQDFGGGAARMRANAGASRTPRNCTCRTTRRWPMHLPF